MTSASDEATYWLIAVPNWASSGDLTSVGKSNNSSQANNHGGGAGIESDDARLTRRALEMKTTKLSENFDFKVPKLRVGTLDTLMNLSDELGKLDSFAESLFKRLARTYKELEKKEEKNELSVEQKSPHDYVENFHWGSAKYPVQAAVKELVARIQQDLNSVDEELRKRTTKFQEVSAALSAIERKETGSLLVKPLGNIVQPADILEKEYISTLLIVVPKAKEKTFEDTYEIMEDVAADTEKKSTEEDKKRNETRHVHAPVAVAAKDLNSLSPEEAEADKKEKEREQRAEERRKAIRNVIPRSLKKIDSDGDFVLYRILILKKGAETIRNICRENRYTVRSYEYDPEQMQNDKDEKAKLATSRTKLLSNLLVWTESTFSDVFSAWIHLKTIRVFVESVLRYGIPVNFQAILLKPKKGARIKLRKSLNELYANLSGASLTGAIDSGESADISGFGAEFYPYVYLPVNLEDG